MKQHAYIQMLKGLDKCLTCGAGESSGYHHPTPPAQIDLARGEERKERVLENHEDRNHDKLSICRSIAVAIAASNGEVAADEVRAEYEKRQDREDWGPWAGSLFRDSRFIPTGRVKKSAVVKRNACLVQVWTLAEEYGRTA